MEEKQKTIDQILRAINGLTQKYAQCNQNAADTIAECEGDKVNACFKCKDPYISFKSVRSEMSYSS
jgi:hypothetical protein